MVSVHLKHDVILGIFYERGVPGEMYSTTVIQMLMLHIYLFRDEYTRAFSKLDLRVRVGPSLQYIPPSKFERVLDHFKIFELFRVEYFRVKSQP